MIKFTEKEIELAMLLKEHGLQWEPSAGDWFYRKGRIARTYCDCVSSYKDGFVHTIEGGLIFSQKTVCWLPLWHDCYAMFQEHNMEITFFSDRIPLVLNLFIVKHEDLKSDSSDEFPPRIYIGQTTGDTGREAMYQAMLLFLTDETNTYEPIRGYDCTSPLEVMKGEPSLTGNVYKDVFRDEGIRYINYYADCAVCVREISLSERKHRIVKSELKFLGWIKDDFGKWVCPDCKEAEDGTTQRETNTTRETDMAEREAAGACEYNSQSIL